MWTSWRLSWSWNWECAARKLRSINSVLLLALTANKRVNKDICRLTDRLHGQSHLIWTHGSWLVQVEFPENSLKRWWREARNMVSLFFWVKTWTKVWKKDLEVWTTGLPVTHQPLPDLIPQDLELHDSQASTSVFLRFTTVKVSCLYFSAWDYVKTGMSVR